MTDRTSGADLRPAPADLTERFDALQKTLEPQWRLISSMNREEHTVVVVTSISIDVEFPPSLLQAYEERFLFLMLLLRQPRTRLIYITSMPILPEIIEYFLALLPGVVPSHARKRLFTVAALDGSSRPLATKILERPRLLSRIRALITDPASTHLVPFNTTETEKELAVRLGIPMYAADPKHLHLGSKTGGRRIFAEEGVPHPLGHDDLKSLDEVVTALAAMRADKPDLGQVIVKLNEGVSGHGNAVVDLAGLPAPGDPSERTTIEERVRGMRFELEDANVDAFMAAMEREGGIVEERIQGEAFTSPSVQMRATPLGELELLSTHDQLLGGTTGQTYTGCLFPADPAYAPLISREAAKVGRRLVREGVWGRFAVDFVVVQSADGDWRAYAIEINLRKGGTTHPYLTLEFLTCGTYDPETARFTTADGRTKHYVASDYEASPLYRGLTPDDLLDTVIFEDLHFDHSTQKGIVLHMLSAVTEHGRFGLTAVGDTPEEARDLYERAVAAIDREAERASQDMDAAVT